MKELEAERERRAKTNKGEVAKQKPPRASATDPEARVIKMADGGFRPAYNMQISLGGGRSTDRRRRDERLGPRAGAPRAGAAVQGWNCG